LVPWNSIFFTAIGEGTTAERIASRAGADARAAKVLLNALVAIDLLRKDGSQYWNSSEAA
jgi:DNA-binding IclR family transcriptional regulator